MNAYRLRLLQLAEVRGAPKSGESWGDVVRRAWITRHQGQARLPFASEQPAGVNTPTPVQIEEAEILGEGSHLNKVFHVTGADGAEGVFKPIRGEVIRDDYGDLVREQINPDNSEATLAEREVLASRIDQALGLGIAPETIMARTSLAEGADSDDRALGVGALARFLDNDGPDQQQIYSHPQNQERAAKLGVFDALIGNLDRHGENFLIGTDGKLYGIDHGYSFGVTTPLTGPPSDDDDSPHFSEPEYVRSWALSNIKQGDLSAETQRDLAERLDAVSWKSLLRGSTLSEEETDALHQRVQLVITLLHRGEAHRIKEHFYTTHEIERPGMSPSEASLPYSDADDEDDGSWQG
jgi:hypothetical protein